MAKIKTGENDLATKYPLVAQEWHPTKNGHLTPSQVTTGSQRKVWWLCKYGHEWAATICNRVKGTGCPICNILNRQKPNIGVNDLQTQSPQLCEEWHPTLNYDISPKSVSSNSHTIVWWLGKCGHEWQAIIRDRFRGHGCPYCAGKRVLAGFNDLISQKPELAQEWHPTKNGSITPINVTVSSGKTVWWLGKCGHEWQAVVKDRNYGMGCPYCVGKKVLIGFNDLASQKPELAQEWHPTKNGKLYPTNVTVNSHKKVWWLGQCGHEWQTTVATRNKGNGCPNCKYIKIAKIQSTPPQGQSLAETKPNLAREWNMLKNGELTPRDVYPQSNKKVWWKCAVGHEWQAPIGKRFIGWGCPVCHNEYKSSYPEQAIFFYIKNLFPEAINRYVENSRELDIFIPSIKIGIEYDGMRYHTAEKLIREQQKDAYFNGQGITTIRVKEVKEKNTSVRIDSHIIYYSPEQIYKFLPAVIEQLLKQFADMGVIKETYIDIDLSRDDGLILSSLLTNMREYSIATIKPLVKEWNYEKNQALNPEYISLGSNKYAWWICDKGHEWRAIVNSRYRGNGCPYCANNKVWTGYNDLLTINPEIAQEWHPTKNGDMRPNCIAPNSHRAVWWLGRCGHEWQATVAHRNRGSNCPICKKNGKSKPKL